MEETADLGVPLCSGTTKKGLPCRSRRAPGCQFCARHEAMRRQVVEEPEIRRKIAIVGFTISYEDAPWGDPEWDVFPCNNLHTQVGPERTAQATGWFNLHDLSKLEDEKAGPGVYDPIHAKFLKEAHCPVLVLKPKPEWPTSIEFPRQEILDFWAEHGIAGKRYFTNSVSWMTAWAILRLKSTGDGTGEIGLWGIDMAQGSEYAAQRPSCEYWLGIAEGLGIKVTIARRADLLRCAFLYGDDEYAEDFVVKMRARTTELEGRLNDMNVQVANHLSQLEQMRYMQHQLTGALESQRYIEAVWLQPEGTRKGGADPYSTGLSPAVVQSDGAGTPLPVGADVGE